MRVIVRRRKTSVHSGILIWCAKGYTEFQLGINRSSRRIARSPACACNDVTNIGALSKEQATCMSCHSNHEKITQRAKILHSKFRDMECHDRFAKVMREGDENDVINIEEDVCHVRTMSVDEERVIRNTMLEPNG